MRQGASMHVVPHPARSIPTHFPCWAGKQGYMSLPSSHAAEADTLSSAAAGIYPGCCRRLNWFLNDETMKCTVYTSPQNKNRKARSQYSLLVRDSKYISVNSKSWSDQLSLLFWQVNPTINIYDCGNEELTKSFCRTSSQLRFGDSLPTCFYCFTHWIH